MDGLIIYFLPTIIALGIITSYEDIKEGKIRNKYIVAGLGMSVGIHGVLLGFRIINAEYVLLMLAYVSIALLLGFLLWYAHVWSAGDAKLFTCYISLIPITTYKIFTLSQPMLTPFINIIIPAFVFVMIKTITDTNRKQKAEALKKAIEPKRLAGIVLLVFGTGGLIRLAFSYIELNQNYFITLAGILIISAAINQTAKKRAPYVYLTLSAARLLFDSQIMRTEFIASFIIVTVGYITLKIFTKELSSALIENIRITKIKAGMIAAETIKTTKNKTVIKENETITKEKIDELIRSNRSRAIKTKSLSVHRTMPFATFMFTGVLLTIFMGLNIIIYARILIGV